LPHQCSYSLHRASLPSAGFRRHIELARRERGEGRVGCVTHPSEAAEWGFCDGWADSPNKLRCDWPERHLFCSCFCSSCCWRAVGLPCINCSPREESPLFGRPARFSRSVHASRGRESSAKALERCRAPSYLIRSDTLLPLDFFIILLPVLCLPSTRFPHPGQRCTAPA
jgi:hypothetical protein